MGGFRGVTLKRASVWNMSKTAHPRSQAFSSLGGRGREKALRTRMTIINGNVAI